MGRKLYLVHRLEECAVEFRAEWEELTGTAPVPWHLLSQREQDETRTSVQTAAWVVAGLLDSGVYSLEVASSLVHESWKMRNWWADARLLVPYSQLPEEEKDKDRALVRIVSSLFPGAHEVREPQ